MIRDPVNYATWKPEGIVANNREDRRFFFSGKSVCSVTTALGYVRRFSCHWDFDGSGDTWKNYGSESFKRNSSLADTRFAKQRFFFFKERRDKSELPCWSSIRADKFGLVFFSRRFYRRFDPRRTRQSLFAPPHGSFHVGLPDLVCLPTRSDRVSSLVKHMRRSNKVPGRTAKFQKRNQFKNKRINEHRVIALVRKYVCECVQVCRRVIVTSDPR